ncbi:hypothetical protein V8G54_013432 [Vigna mungo]|uniref:Retroviral polymerase SH3-like domain-containing protein n=1 Tax=Vigna mungo TaxID=3915 RepID=A0AAQ3NSY1_VIGMU
MIKKSSDCRANAWGKEFEIKTLGKLKYFLGIEVAHSKKGIFISQQKYITDLLKETGKAACKPASTPLEPNIKLGNAEDVAVEKEMYQRLVGRLIYLSHTRPDIAYAVSLISQFMHSPKETHLQAAHRILQYLKGTPGRGILFKRNGNVKLEAYTDADYAESIVDRRSTTGYCTFLGGNLVTWRSKKQGVVAQSSAEAEFRAMAQGICELLWLKIILEDLRIKWEEPMKLYCDNKSAISIAHNPVQHDRTKHIEVDTHFIKEKLDSGLICTPYVSSQDQIADILTKGLGCTILRRLYPSWEWKTPIHQLEGEVSIWKAKKKSIPEVNMESHSQIAAHPHGCFRPSQKTFLKRSDGKEYTTAEFDKFCENSGIEHQLTSPYTSTKCSESRNKYIMGMSRCMLHEKNLPKKLPTKAVKGLTPFEAWYGYKPSLKFLKVFGCLCFTHVPHSKRDKLDRRASPGIFIGYSTVSKAYKIFQPQTRNIVISKDVHFEEDEELHLDNSEKKGQIIAETQKKMCQTIDDDLVRGTRSLSDIYERSNNIVCEPADYVEAKKDQRWINAMEEELSMIKKNKTWIKWVFRTKLNVDG